MPTYEYQCENCGHSFEKFQSITAGSLRKCPQCKKMTLRRLIGAGAGIIFKGSGFYQTDYRTESYNIGAQSEKPASEKKDADKGKESKPKAETPAKTKTESKTTSKDKKKD